MAEPKKKYTDQERSELAAKLDADCDAFMDALAANAQNRPKKPFDFEEWCRDIDSHPAFMNSLNPSSPSGGGELSDAVQALQALKYDTDGEDAIDTATRHKDEGNKHFKYKKYRWATDCYTEAAKVMAPDRKLNAVIYSNRAAAHKYLKNYRSALRDCLAALRFDPLHAKAMIRACEVLTELNNPRTIVKVSEECINRLKASPDVSDAIGAIEKLTVFHEKASIDFKNQLAAEKREKAHLNLDNAAKAKLLQLLKARGIKTKPRIDYDDSSAFEWSELEVSFPHHPATRVKAGGGKAAANVLEWPLMIQYPQFGQTDFLTDCSELSLIGDLLSPVFSSPAEWDLKHEFTAGNVRVFIELDIFDDEQVQEISLDTNLGTVLASKDFYVVQGLPVITLYTKEYVSTLLTKVDGFNDRYRFKKVTK